MREEFEFDKGIITLSFDDARKDTYIVFKELLEPLQLPFTLNVPSGYIETGFDDYRDIGYNGLMSKDELDELEQSELVEISSHGYMHTDTDEDTIEGVKCLMRWYPRLSKGIGYAVPHSSIGKLDIKRKMSMYKELGIRYVRGGRDFEKNRIIKRAISLMARLFDSSFLFVQLYKGSLNKNRSFYLNAIPLNRKTSFKQIKAIVDYCVKNKVWGIIEIHGIDYESSKEYQEIYCYNRRFFHELCNYLNVLIIENKIAVKKTIDVYD